MPRKAIFDFDGIILNSFPDQFIWFKKISSILGVEFPYDIEGFKRAYKEPVYPDMYEFLNLGWNKNKGIIWEEYNKHKASAEIKLFDGIRNQLDGIRDSGIEMSIASSNTRKAIDKQLEDHGLRDFFNYLTTKEDLPTYETGEPMLKPNPACLLIAMDKLKINPNECIYIGDQISDIEASRNVAQIKNKPIKVLAITYGYGTKSQLLEANAEAYAHHPNDLASKVKMLCL